MLVTRKRISLALGLLALVNIAVAGQVQAAPPSQNQATADAVAGALRAYPAFASSQIDIEAISGNVTLSGLVKDAALKAQAVTLVRQVPGVVNVTDRLAVAGDSGVMPAQYVQPTQVALGGHGGHSGGHGGMIYDGGAIAGGAVAGGAAGMMGLDGGPVPEGPAIPGAGQGAQPGYPNYAWPSYAPHPNFSAVGYPTVYPWQAWPNIGPFYPYPEVPLDWRAVTLRWDDGLWWLDFKKHYTRPFFTPYPFGIFGY